MDIVIVGGGGHSKVIADIIALKPDCRITAVLDDKYSSVSLQDGMYQGPLSYAKQLLQDRPHLKFIVAVGDNAVRKSIVTRLELMQEQFAVLIHPSAVVSPSATIGPGSVVMAHCVVHADAIIGTHTIVNTGAIIEHDTKLADYVHAAPRTTLTGAAEAAEGVMIGAGAIVIPQVKIGKWATVGAGATVIHDVAAHCTVVGTPAREMVKVYGETVKL